LNRSGTSEVHSKEAKAPSSRRVYVPGEQKPRRPASGEDRRIGEQRTWYLKAKDGKGVSKGDKEAGRYNWDDGEMEKRKRRREPLPVRKKKSLGGG
jgi:hypothetical protein